MGFFCQRADFSKLKKCDWVFNYKVHWAFRKKILEKIKLGAKQLARLLIVDRKNQVDDQTIGTSINE